MYPGITIKYLISNPYNTVISDSVIIENNSYNGVSLEREGIEVKFPLKPR